MKAQMRSGMHQLLIKLGFRPRKDDCASWREIGRGPSHESGASVDAVARVSTASSTRQITEASWPADGDARRLPK
jgi:hypothetical protein